MAALSNFPLVNQLTPVTGDGKPSENAELDCVAASIVAICRWLLGQPENKTFNPDAFKDAAYGDGYTGGTSAERYVAFCKSLGINLYPVDCSSYGAAVATARKLIEDGKPVIFTEDDPYVDTSLPQYAGWTHVCVWHATDEAGLTAMDPWGGKNLYKSDATWANVLRSSQLWTAERTNMIISIDTPGVKAYYKQNDEHTWEVIADGASKGLLVRLGMLDLYKRLSASPRDLAGLTWLGLPLTNEISLGNGIAKQYFERGCLVYDSAKSKDSPVKSEAVYTAHVYGNNALGQDPHIPEMLKQIAILQQQLQAALQQPGQNQDQIKGMLAAFQSIQTTIAPFIKV